MQALQHTSALPARNDHHQCEAAFKAFGIALGKALSKNEKIKDIPSTKGTF